MPVAISQKEHSGQWGTWLGTRTNDTSWRHRNPFQHGNSCFPFCWSLFHLCTVAPPHSVPTRGQEGVKPKLSFPRAGTELRVHTTTAEPTWPYLRLIPLPCEARAQQPLSGSVPNSQEKTLVVRVAMTQSPCPHIPVFPSGTAVAGQGGWLQTARRQG